MLKVHIKSVLKTLVWGQVWKKIVCSLWSLLILKSIQDSMQKEFKVTHFKVFLKVHRNDKNIYKLKLWILKFIL